MHRTIAYLFFHCLIFDALALQTIVHKESACTPRAWDIFFSQKDDRSPSIDLSNLQRSCHCFTFDDYSIKKFSTHEELLRFYQATVTYPVPRYRSREKERALLVAVRENRAHEVSVLLFREKINPNFSDKAGRTPLISATVRCNPRIISYLLWAGADPNAQDRSNRTALRYLGLVPSQRLYNFPGGYFYTLHYLIALTNSELDTTIIATMMRKNYNLARAIQYVCSNRIFESISSNNSTMVENAIKAGIDVNSRDMSKFEEEDDEILFDSAMNTPLIYAAFYQATGYRDSFDFFNYQGLRYSCERPFVANKDEHTTIMHLLLKAGADVNAQNIHGVTPLIAAILVGNIDDVKLLLDAGADIITLKTHSSQTYSSFEQEKNALSLAKQKSPIYELLLMYYRARCAAPEIESFFQTKQYSCKDLAAIVYDYLIPDQKMAHEAMQQRMAKPVEAENSCAIM